MRTEVEHTFIGEGDRIMWAKDVAAGAGLVMFMVWAFVLASGAQAVVHHLPV
jgi:diacylglycerol kinase